MGIGSGKLNRLIVGSSCAVPWEGMQGEGSGRFCASCQREVLDFAQLTARQIRSRIEAHGGEVCARLTRRGGELAFVSTGMPSAPPLDWAPRRVSPVVATLVTAWLGVGAAEARSGPSRPAAPASSPREASAESADGKPGPPLASAPLSSAELRGRVLDEAGDPLPGTTIELHSQPPGTTRVAVTNADGDFRFSPLPASSYIVLGELEGFQFQPLSGIVLRPGDLRSVALQGKVDPTQRETITVGELVVTPEPLHRLFEESDLVVVGHLGATTLVKGEVDYADLATEVRIDSLLKGRISDRTVLVVTSILAASVDRDAFAPPELAAGTWVLAFLQTSHEGGGRLRGLPAYESADYATGIRRLPAGDRASYVQRIEALARLERKIGRGGEADPAALMEWFVATAVDPHTRTEAAGEIGAALQALMYRALLRRLEPEAAAAEVRAAVEAARANGERANDDLGRAFLATFLTERQRGRLTTALRVAEDLGEGDLSLFWLVRQWDGEAATAWLIERLRRDSSRAKDTLDLWHLRALAVGLDHLELKALSDAALELQKEIDALWPDDRSEAAERVREERRLELFADVRQRFAELLGKEQ